MIRILGISAILAAAVAVRRLYVSYTVNGEQGCEEYLSLIEHIHRRIGCYLEPTDVWIRQFESRMLEACGFLKKVREGETLSDAYCSAREVLRLPKEADELLFRCFSGFGRGYREEELRALKETKESLRIIIEKEKSENEKRRKVASAVIISVCLGLVLLLL